MRLDCVYGCFSEAQITYFGLNGKTREGGFSPKPKRNFPSCSKTPPYRDKKRGIIFPKAAEGALQAVKMSLPVAPKRYGPGKKTYSDKDKNNGQPTTSREQKTSPAWIMPRRGGGRRSQPTTSREQKTSPAWIMPRRGGGRRSQASPAPAYLAALHIQSLCLLEF